MDYFTKYKKQLHAKLHVLALHKDYVEHISVDGLQILTAIYLSDKGRLPRSVLKDLLNLTGSQLTRSTQALIRSGILYYETCIIDGRSKCVCLTALGKKLQKTYLETQI